MTGETDYIMNKMKEIIDMYFELKGDQVTEVDIAHYASELNIGVEKLKELIK